MFWMFLLIIAFALILIKLGAASVMVGVLSMGLHAAALLIAILVIHLLWTKFSKQKTQSKE